MIRSVLQIASAVLCAAFILCAACFMCGCRRYNINPQADATQSPVSSPAPDVDYTFTHYIRYWPETAGYDDCEYAVTVQIPQFSNTFTAGYNMNAAVQGYVDGLYARVESTYMGLAVADPPYTEVSCEVVRAGDYTNVIFTESHCYEAQPTVETYVLILDEDGLEVNLDAVFSTYHAEALAASAIVKIMASGDIYYDGIDETAVLAALDIKNGCRVTETGCVIYLHEGIFAPYDYKELQFELPSITFCPAFITDSDTAELTEVQYRLVEQYMGYLISACIIREDEFSDGTLTEYSASAFMGDAVLALGLTPSAGRVYIGEQDYLNIYQSCFGVGFPGIDTDGHSITLSDGLYSVSTVQQAYVYGLDMTSASFDAESGILTISGDVMFGAPGYAYTTYVCHAVLELRPNSDSPFGFTFISLDFTF